MKKPKKAAKKTAKKAKQNLQKKAIFKIKKIGGGASRQPGRPGAKGMAGAPPLKTRAQTKQPRPAGAKRLTPESKKPAREPAPPAESRGGNFGDGQTPFETASASPYPFRDIVTEMEESYLDYAMSVIVSRALPDTRDGLKPVHRRILHVMNELGLSSGAKFRKCAAIVGDTLGKYHPHGDMAVYDALVRMAQDFSLRYPLVEGQGNFGSIDGDNAAAYRYTEARMTKFAEEMLADIEKETVDFRDNFDGTRKEPIVLPSKLPQLILNGIAGIAVGMATSIPPHNLSEVVDSIIHLSEHPNCTIDELMEYIKGPDFPTGGIIYGKEDIKAMYVNGRGGVVTRAKAEIEERKGGKFAIIVTEIPYQVNKAQLVSKIAELVAAKRIVGISDVRDESNRHGISVVIELKKDSYPKKILNQLFKYTPLQTTFNMNMIALVDGIQPRLLNLKQVLEYFIEHRKVTITRRTAYELKVAKARAHILEGLKKALDHIDAVIKTIKQSKTKEDAHAALIKQFKLSDAQATAILEMRLQTLAGLERKKIEDELKEKLELITYLEGVLKDPKKILGIMKKELEEIKQKYGDERRTKIVGHAVSEISAKDTIPDEPMVVTLTRGNYIKRMPPSTFRTQHRGGKGVIGMMTQEEDEINMICHTRNHENLLFFTNKGRVFTLPVYEVPQASRIAKGQPIVNLIQLQEGEFVTAMLNVSEKFTGEFLFMCTKSGTVKKTPVSDFQNVRRSGLIAIRLRPNDSLEWVKEVKKGDDIFIATAGGKSIRFDQNDAREMGRPSMGVRGIHLKEKDEVVEMDVIRSKEAEVLVVMENGLGKATKCSNYRRQHRGGSGIKTAKVTPKTGKVIAAKVFDEKSNADLICVSKEGQVIRLDLKDIPSQGRATQGVFIMRLNKGDRVASVSLIMKTEEDRLEGERVPKPLLKEKIARSPEKQKALL